MMFWAKHIFFYVHQIQITVEGLLKSNYYNILLFTGTTLKTISEQQPAYAMYCQTERLDLRRER